MAFEWINKTADAIITHLEGAGEDRWPPALRQMLERVGWRPGQRVSRLHIAGAALLYTGDIMGLKLAIERETSTGAPVT